MVSPKSAAGLAVVLLTGVLLVLLVTALPGTGPDDVVSPWIGPWLWSVRGLDLLFQALLVLAGVWGVLLVLGPVREGP